MPSVYEHVDLIVVRENTEGMYTGFEFEMGTVAVKELIRFVEDTTGRRIREDSGISIKIHQRSRLASGSCGSRSRKHDDGDARRSRPATRPTS